MDTIALKKEISGKIAKIANPEILQDLNEIVSDLLMADMKGDFWDDLPSSVKENILLSRQEIREGKTHDHGDVMKEMKQWLKK